MRRIDRNSNIDYKQIYKCTDMDNKSITVMNVKWKKFIGIKYEIKWEIL